MKNKSFMIIIFVSLVVFASLLFSIYRIVAKEAKVFYTDGYVSISDAEVSEKIYFNEGTSYKRGYGKEVIFKDKDDVKQEVGKFNFVYYSDKSINFLNDGVLLDLNEVNAAFVPYYNIKSNYLIEYNTGKYVIKSQDKDIVLDNFIGRISENKYLVAGNDLKLKLSSSEELTSNYYFELNFIDGQTVKIDNDQINLETISDECYIMVGDNIKIDLSKQVIFYNEEAKINLSEIIINHDENIDILYDENELGGEGSGEGEGEGTGDGGAGTQTPVEPEIPEYEVETVIEYKNVPYVEFLSSNVNSHKMEFKFNVIDQNNLISGPVTVRYVDLQTGQENKKEYINYSGTLEFIADGLRSDTNYLVTIYTSYVRNNNIYNDYSMFQRTFSTKDMGVELQKDYVTSNEIAYNIKLSKNATFTSGTLNLYDSEGNLVDSYDFKNNGQDINTVFTDLNSNSKYIAKIENITYGNVTYTGGSAAVYEQRTLKYNPFKDGILVTSPLATVNKKDYFFKFDLGEIKDLDLAVTGVTYNIYDKDTGQLVKSIKKDTLNAIEVPIDDEVKNHTTYYYKAVIALNDNEKKIEYETLASNDFNMSAKASPTMRFNTTGITANTLNGYFVITDNDNTIDTNQSIYVEYTNTLGVSQTKMLAISACPNEESETTKCVDLELTDLSSDDVYTINLMAYVDLKDEVIEPGITLIGAIKVTTEQADIILTDMKASDLDETTALDKFFEVSIQFSIDETTDEAIKNNMSSFDIMLYEGADATGMYLSTIRIGAETNIVEEFFNNPKTFTLKDFGLTLDDLIRIHVSEGGIISKKYTIKLTNGKSGMDYVEFKPYSLTFEINDILLGLTNNDASIEVTPILNDSNNKYHDNTLNNDTIIGLKVIPEFGNKKYASKINFVVKDVTTGNITSINYSEFLDLDDGSIVPVFEFMFEDYPDFFRRGRVYQIEYTLDLDLNDDGETDLVYPFSIENIGEPAPVISDMVAVPKQVPSMILFPWTSANDSISYKYSVTDIDNALPSDYKVYYEVNEQSAEALDTKCSNPLKVTGYTSNYKCMSLSGLNAGNIYHIYLNPILIEREGEMPTRVDINNFTFEGINDIANVRFDLEVGEDGLQKYNNLFSLKITEPYDFLTEEEKEASKATKNRIAYYTLEFTLNDGKKFVIDNINDSNRTTSPISSNIIEYTYGSESIKWNNQSRYDNLSKVAFVSTCDDEVSSCLYVDYSKIYNSTTFKNVFSAFRNQNISITLKAMYDTGKIGYQADPQKVYAFQVMSNEEIINGELTYNDNYLLVHGTAINRVTFSPAALSAVYSYVNARGGFVDDSLEDNKIGTGKMYFINTIYSNLSIVTPNANYLSPNYVITDRGVEVTFGYGASAVSVPLVAKELASTSLNGTGTFTFDRVIPAINVNAKNATINGAKLNLALSGITETDITKEDDKYYLHLEVFDKESNNLIKSLKINKDNLTSQTGIVANSQYKVSLDDAYKVDVTSVKVGGIVVEDYQYDYKTGIITFSDASYDNLEVSVDYQIVIDKLNVGATYYLKAYMMMDNKKTYLVDAKSSTYETFVYEFTTKTSSEVSITKAALDTESETDYATRFLTTSYTIDEIVGINNIKYEICNADKSICIDASAYKSCSADYNSFAGTCFNKNGGYNAKIYHDISITEDLDFLFDTDYNVVLTAEVIEEDGNVHEHEIYNQSLHLRALNKPSVNVIKNAGFKDGKKPYLSFDVAFTDVDRVISKPEINKENGQYIAYLAMGTDRVKIQGTEQVINVTENGLDKAMTITYENLDVESAYYLIIEYKTYTNNAGTVAESSFSIPYLIYTLGDNGISVGRIEYSATSNTSILKFGYATNMTRNYIQREDGTLIPDPDQEAYVAGIVYHITRTSGDNLFAIDGTLIFDDENKIEHKNDSSSSETVGDNYYQITIPNTVYPVGAGYSIIFQFYLGGNVANELTSESLCKNAGVSNHWNSTTNECYILDDTKYDAYTMYGSGNGQ